MNKTSLLVGSLVCCLLFTNQASASTPDSTAISRKPTWSVLLGTNASIVLPSHPFYQGFVEAPRGLLAIGIVTPYSRVKAGFSAGVGFSASLKKNWALELNMICQQKGFSDWHTDPLEKRSTVHLNYVSARQMLKRRFTEKWSFSAGIEESFLVDQRQNFKDTTETTIWNWDVLNEFLNGPGSAMSFARIDFSVLCGVEFNPSSLPATIQLVAGFGLIPIGWGELIFTDEQGTPLRILKDRNAFINLSVSYPFSRKT